jgi:hypothetical protein
VREAPGANGALLGTISIDADRASSRSADDTEGSLHDLVTQCAGHGMPQSTVLGDVVPAPGFSGVVVPGVAGLPLAGSPSFPAPPIDGRQVEGDAEFACLQVAAAERLLHEMLVSVGRNLLHPIRVSLKKERNVCLCAYGLLRVQASPLILLLLHLS